MGWAPNWEDVKAKQQDRYEEAVCRRIAKLLKRSDILENAEMSQQPLTLDWLLQHLDTRILLRAAKLPYLHDLEKDLAERHTKTAIFREIEQMLEEHPCAVVGLVFQWPGNGKFFVLHTIPTCPQVSKQGRFWRHGNTRYWLQSLSDTLQELQLLTVMDNEEDQ